MIWSESDGDVLSGQGGGKGQLEASCTEEYEL